MNSIISYFINLCLFRAGPQDAPKSQTLLYITGFVLVFSYMIVNSVFNTIEERLLVASSQVIIFAGVVWLLLKINNKVERWQQTTIALFGSATILEIVQMPLTLLNSETNHEGFSPLLIIYIMVGLWYLAILSNICRQALDVTLTRGIGCCNILPARYRNGSRISTFSTRFCSIFR